MIILQFFPNGEFTQGVDTSVKRRSRLERLSDKLANNPTPVEISDICAEMNAEMSKDDVCVGTTFMSAQTSLHTYLGRYHQEHYYSVEPQYGEPYVIDSPHAPRRYAYLVGSSDLGSSDGRNFTEKPKASKKRGLTMTKSMARNIRNAGYLLETQYGKDNLSFLTLTLPDLPADGLSACAEKWGYMVDRFLKWLRSVIEERYSEELHYTYCTEVQTKRLTERGEYALHLHLLFVGRKSRIHPWYVSPAKVRKAWVRCIKSVYSGSFKTTALENLQRVRKSAAKYLSKYVSKGARSNNEHIDSGDVPRFRGHWGGISRKLRQSIRRATTRVVGRFLSGETCHSWLKCIPGFIARGVVSYFCQGFIQTSYGEDASTARGIHVGVGSLAKPLLGGGLSATLELMDEICEEMENEEL